MRGNIMGLRTRTCSYKKWRGKTVLHRFLDMLGIYMFSGRRTHRTFSRDGIHSFPLELTLLEERRDDGGE